MPTDSTRSPRPPRPSIGLLAVGVGLLSCVLVAPGTGRAATADADELRSRLDALFAEAYAPDEPGAAVLVKRGDEVILRKGYGMAELELGVAIAPEMVFRLGSITKQFSAVATLMLEQEGKLDVSDPVTKHLPDYPAIGANITIEHLLTHTSGIPSYTDDPAFWETVRDESTVAKMVDSFDDKELQFDPGTVWRYSNSGYFLLGAIIEAVSGERYEDFIEARIFGPLGMTRSDYGDHARIIPGRVRGYHLDDDAYVNAPYLSMSQPYAAGSLLSRVDDLARWDAALYTDQLLPAEARQRLWTRYRLKDGEPVDYGYGWSIHTLDGRSAVSHGGGIFGFSTMVIRVPDERLFIAVLSNNPGHQPGPGLLARKATDLVLGRSVATGASHDAVSLDADALDDYVGVYRIDAETTRAVTVEDGRLVTQRSGGGKSTPAALGDDRFLYPDSLTRARFVRGSRGRVTHMLIEPWGGATERAERTDEALPKAPKRADIDPAIFDRYAGDYALMPGLVVTIYREGDKLMAKATGQGAIEIIPESETVFFNDTIGARMTFTTGGDTVTLLLEQGGQKLEAERSP